MRPTCPVDVRARRVPFHASPYSPPYSMSSIRSAASLTAVLTGLALAMASAPAAQAQATDPFAPLTIGPAPSQTRLANGAPGPKYWQNRADYDLHATLDTAAHTIRGSLTLRYTNNSPDVLKTMWFQTEQDPDEPISRFVQDVHGKLTPVTLANHNTETEVTLAAPIKPGETATFQVDWQFNKFHGGRTAHQGVLYEVAQWYPRVNVYDDVKGWNTEPYTTGAEFFLDYGDYTLTVTAPAGYIIAATGTLDNAKDVLTPTEISRLAVAAKADTVVRVVTQPELESGAARPTKDGTLTWKFHAKNVRDAVWCAAPDFQWDATSWHGVLAQSYYQPPAASIWNEAADMARMSIQEYSERWFPYPYPQVSVVAGPVFGMEYPMLSMDGMVQSNTMLYSVITHEVGHNWFPMIVGSNERVHTWQDEGFNQFINTFSEARRYPQGGDQAARAVTYVRGLGQSMAQGQDEVLETGQVIGNSGGQYFKTAAVLQMLRRDVMGPETFDKGLRTYIQRWAYKHPTPMDFFRTMSDVAGKNLDWYWREMFLEDPKFDQAIDSVQVNGTHVRVVYGNQAPGVLPLLVRVTFADSTKQDFTYPVDIWKAGTTYVATYDFPGKTVKEIRIDPERHFIDALRTNNIWTAK